VLYLTSEYFEVLSMSNNQINSENSSGPLGTDLFQGTGEKGDLERFERDLSDEIPGNTEKQPPVNPS
jgi:hypothetical protein